MRAMFLLLIGVPILSLGGCSSNKPTPPPPPKKELVVGKWKTPSDALFLQGFEFSEDGTMKMMYNGMKKPIMGKFTWTDERSMEVEYEKEAKARQDYEAAAEAYKNKITEDMEKQTMDPKIGQGMLGGLVDKLPDKEIFRVGISDPRYLVLVRGGATLNLDRIDEPSRSQAPPGKE